MCRSARRVRRRARAIESFQSPCTGDESGDSPPALDKAILTVDLDVAGAVSGVGFRCGQEICAFALEEGDTAKALLQPCDMNPSAVALCSCHYDVDFKWQAKESALKTLEVWQRGDRGGDDDPAPHRVAAEPLDRAPELDDR